MCLITQMIAILARAIEPPTQVATPMLSTVGGTAGGDIRGDGAGAGVEGGGVLVSGAAEMCENLRSTAATNERASAKV